MFKSSKSSNKKPAPVVAVAFATPVPQAEADVAIAEAAAAVPAPAAAALVIPTHATRTSAAKQANPKSKSDIPNPVQAAWALFGTLAARPGGVTRKEAVQAAMDAGIAFYTARTQYQLFSVELRKQNSPEAQAARAAAEAMVNGSPSA